MSCNRLKSSVYVPIKEELYAPTIFRRRATCVAGISILLVKKINVLFFSVAYYVK